MRLLHISDIHFGLRENEAHAQSSTHRYSDSDGRPDPLVLPGILQSDEAVAGVDLVVISGDLGWTGIPSDYGFALESIRAIEGLVGSGRVVLCPGNHDVNLSKSENFDDRQDAYEALVRILYGGRLQDLYPALVNSSGDLDKRERLVGFHVRGDALVVSVNSAALQNRESTPIAIRSQLLRYIEQQLLKPHLTAPQLRIFVIHHHLFPFVEMSWDAQINIQDVVDKPDSTIIANAARVQHWLTRNRFDVVLHGHKHMHHGREDKLWRASSSPDERRLVVIGAGSAGVSNDQRPHSEPISYNIIDLTPTGHGSWRIQVDVRQVDEARSPVSAIPWFHYAATAGKDEHGLSHVFTAKRMDHCHAEISRSAESAGVIRNFVSIVTDSNYVHPSSLRDGETIPTRDDVDRCFRALHPEYSAIAGWEDIELVDDALRTRRDRLEHGSRIFRKSASGVSPLDSAIRLIDTRPSWAYVGLYRPTLDTDRTPRPMPGLMSIQLVPIYAEQRLDIVATFRNIELSFWWVVNMLELRKLLEYCGPRCESDLRPGSVTMFAALAEWKRAPEPVYVARLDEMDLAELLELCIGARDKRQEYAERLAGILEEKAQDLTPYNVEVTGIDLMLSSLRAVQHATRRNSRDLRLVIEAISASKATLKFTDRSTAADRRAGSVSARNYLREAARLLREIRIFQR